MLIYSTVLYNFWCNKKIHEQLGHLGAVSTKGWNQDIREEFKKPNRY